MFTESLYFLSSSLKWNLYNFQRFPYWGMGGSYSTDKEKSPHQMFILQLCNNFHVRTHKKKFIFSCSHWPSTTYILTWFP